VVAARGQRYDVVVAPEAGPILLAALPGFTPAEGAPGECHLVGEVRDQAAVSALVQRLSDLRIELLCLRRLDA